MYTHVMNALDAYLPELTRERIPAGIPVRTPGWFGHTVDLLDSKPLSTERLAAIVVHRRGIRREVRHEQLELSEEKAAKMPDAPPEKPVPVGVTHRSIESRRLEPAACSGCLSQPGRIPCPLCQEAQWAFERNGFSGGTHDRSSRDTPCENNTIPCTVCDGAGRSVRATIRCVDDVRFQWRDVFLPELPRELSDAVEALLSAGGPDCLRHDPEEGPSSGPYREAANPAHREFHGHSLDGVIERCLAAIGEVRSVDGLLKSRVDVWAWPLLHARYRVGVCAYDAVVVANPRGDIVAYTRHDEAE